jgi:hypothetical protein
VPWLQVADCVVQAARTLFVLFTEPVSEPEKVPAAQVVHTRSTTPPAAAE